MSIAAEKLREAWRKAIPYDGQLRGGGCAKARQARMFMHETSAKVKW